MKGELRSVGDQILKEGLRLVWVERLMKGG